MNDIEVIQNVLKVSEETAKDWIERKIINVDFLRNGYSKEINKELGNISDNFSNNVNNIIDEEKL